jgi:translation elongation factor EF-G
VPRICFINKMDRVGANFWGTIDQIKERLGASPLPIQIPIGKESGFTGMVDLITQEALTFGANANDPIQRGPIPDDMMEEVAQHREQVVERVIELDDQLMERYLEGEVISPEEIRATLRRATIAGQLIPVLCGTALKNKGVRPLLDAVVDYLPSPLDIPPITGSGNLIASRMIGVSGWQSVSPVTVFLRPTTAAMSPAETESTSSRWLACSFTIRPTRSRSCSIQSMVAVPSWTSPILYDRPV